MDTQHKQTDRLRNQSIHANTAHRAVAHERAALRSGSVFVAKRQAGRGFCSRSMTLLRQQGIHANTAHRAVAHRLAVLLAYSRAVRFLTGAVRNAGLPGCLVVVLVSAAARGDESAAPAWARPRPQLVDVVGTVSLEEGFSHPPRTCSTAPLWSWNGRLEPAELRRQIDEMVDKGVYGAFMHARDGLNDAETPYFSDGWWDAVAASVEHAKKVGFAAWMYDEDKWPSGAAGGRTLAADPEGNTRKQLTRTELRVTGPQAVEVRFPDATYVVAGRVVDDKTLAGDTLTEITSFNASATPWPCPEGDWLIVAYTMGPVKRAEGVINYLNPQTISTFMDITHEAYAARVGGQFGGAIPGIFFDEIHNSGAQTVWGEGFAERFRTMKGYDLIPLLPGLVLDIGPQTPKLRCDYYDVYTTIYEETWFQRIADWCDEHRLMLTGHTVEEINAYLTQGDYFRTMRHLHIPATDNEDFRYSWPRVIGAWKPKQMASLCHVYGRPLVGVEAMGGAGWSFTLDSARYGFNMLAAYGVSFFVPHLFHYAQDSPTNVDDWPNSWFFRNPFWKYYKTFADHGSRLTFMLAGTEHAVDVAVLFPTTNLWAGYGGGTTVQTIQALVAGHVDADLIDPDSLARAKVADGQISIADMRYRVLVLPGVRCMRRDVATRVREFVASGGILIVHDRWPTDSMEAGRDDPEIAPLATEATAKGVTLSKLGDTVRRVSEAVERDVMISGDGAEHLRYHHVRRDGKEIYWFANGSREAGRWRVSVRCTGSPAIWQPEDGSTTPISAYVARGGRTECDLQLDGWQGCFLVVDPAVLVPKGGVLVTSTNLSRPVVGRRAAGDVTVRGLLPPEAERAEVQAVVYAEGQEHVTAGTAEAPPRLPVVNLDSDWWMLAAGDRLDDVWSVDLDETELELPVMRVQWERESAGQALGWHFRTHDDGRWRQIKVRDARRPEAGADRYRSRWQARFISYYDSAQFRAPFGGKGLQCRTTFTVTPRSSARGWLAVICESPFEVIVNGQSYPGRGARVPQRFELRHLRPGENTITIAAENAPAVLAEGQLFLDTDTVIQLFTDATWEVMLPEKQWQPAWEYVAPPEQPYGEPAYPQELPEPSVVWYRQALPPGVVAVRVPRVEGEWRVWVDGQAVPPQEGWLSLPEGTRGEVVALRVAAGPGQRGLIEPVRVRCRPAERPLGCWTRQGLDWYSGRVLYSRQFVLPAECVGPGVRLSLDLGRVNYCAEVWLNGKLLGTRVWPPYTFDVTGHLTAGENRVDVVVANLLANRMHWDIFDEVKAAPLNRKWHDGNLLRDGWCFESGLIGPVRIVSSREVTVTLE